MSKSKLGEQFITIALRDSFQLNLYIRVFGFESLFQLIERLDQAPGSEDAQGCFLSRTRTRLGLRSITGGESQHEGEEEGEADVVGHLSVSCHCEEGVTRRSNLQLTVR